MGYNLNELVPEIGRRHATNGKLNVARLIVGSEGTFVSVVEAKMRLIRRPKKTAVEVIHYREIQEALESSSSLLETGPYAVELTDKMILDLARNNIEQSQRMGFVQGDPGAIMPSRSARRPAASSPSTSSAWIQSISTFAP